MQEIDYLRITRHNILNLVNGLSITQLNTIPEGFKNNIIWNFGHLVVTQQLLCYKLPGTPMKISEAWVEKYRKGTQADNAVSEDEIQELKATFLEIVEELQKDYEAGIFKNYTTYPTSYNIELSSIEDAIKFNNIHEGLHFGYMMAMRKLV